MLPWPPLGENTQTLTSQFPPGLPPEFPKGPLATPRKTARPTTFVFSPLPLTCFAPPGAPSGVPALPSASLCLPRCPPKRSCTLKTTGLREACPLSKAHPWSHLFQKLSHDYASAGSPGKASEASAPCRRWFGLHMALAQQARTWSSFA